MKVFFSSENPPIETGPKIDSEESLNIKRGSHTPIHKKTGVKYFGWGYFLEGRKCVNTLGD